MELEKKLELIKDVLDVESLAPEDNLSDIEEWDSLSALSIVIMVKDEFNRVLTGDEVRNFKTIQDILDVMS